MNQIKLVFVVIFLNSCFFGGLNTQYNTVYNLPSVGDSTKPSSSTYFYFDVDRFKYDNRVTPYYEISTTEEFGDSAQRNSVSNCEIPFVPIGNGNLSISESTENLICILDLLEGDLVIKDLHLVFNFPEGMCSYVRTRLPWHFNHEILPGPIVQEVTCGEGASEGCETTYRNTQSELPAGWGAPTSGVTEQDDLCPSVGADSVKCCSGGRKSSEGEQEGDRWEPDEACFGGPALVTTGDIAVEGNDDYSFVVARLMEVPEGGLKTEFTIPSLLENHNNSFKFSTSMANYHSDLDLPPEDLNQLRRNSLPVFLQNSDNFPYSPQLFFEFECLDQGSESLHKILVLIREWNTLEEFWNFYQDGGNDDTDPDITGFEGTDCDYEEDRSTLWGEEGLCNDSKDLDDITRGYPKAEYESSN